MPAPFTRLAARLGSPHSDGDLLARFVQDRDEAAFAVLVHRHGPTVFGVCRRVLGHSADAEDAFQAVFLVLVNRADALTHRRTLGDWLHGVAVRTALKARTRFARLRKHERTASERRPEAAFDPTPTEPSWIDRELSALPDKFREPVVLCLLQDRPRAEVAAELGIPEGTLASRLDTARKRLADRLARHRVPLAFAGLLVPVPAAVADAAVNRVTDGAGVAIHQLANEVTRSMLTNSKWPVLIAAGVLTAAVGGLLLAAGPDDRNASVPDRPAVAQDKNDTPDKALVGDWKVLLALDSEPPPQDGYTKFARLAVAKDGTCELFGQMDSIYAEYRHRDFAMIGTLIAANDKGVMELDLSYQHSQKPGQPIGPVVYKCIAKRDGSVLIVALGRARSDSRPKSFDDLTTAARAKTPIDKEKQTPPITLLVFGADQK